MQKYTLDYALVPLGLVVMVVYHMWLLRQILRRPSTTVIGINAVNRRLWVRAMMEDPSKNGILAVQTLRNNIMASTVLASTAIMLSSVIAVLMSGGSCGHRPIAAVYGDNSKLGSSIKFFSILVCFLCAFLLNVQSIRYYSHASILINVPPPTATTRRRSKGKTVIGDDVKEEYSVVTEEYVWKMVNKGSCFWSLGLHAFYFSFPLFLWIFGPIPMVLSCIFLVILLYFLDFAADDIGNGTHVAVASADHDHDHDKQEDHHYHRADHDIHHNGVIV